MPAITDLFWHRETEAERDQLVAARLGVRAPECLGSSQPHAWTPQLGLAHQWVQNTPALPLDAAGARRRVLSGQRLLALGQGGSQQGKTGMNLISYTILWGIMGLSWIYPRRNAILDWVTCAARLTAGGKWRGTVNLCVVSLSGCISGESQYLSSANTLPLCPSSWLRSSHF